MTEDFAERLRTLREGQGLTVQEMADRTGVPKRSLEKYMLRTEANTPGLDALVKLSKGLSISLDWLEFGGNSTGQNAGRLVRLSARAASLQAFQTILVEFQSQGSAIFSEGTILGLSPEEWAAEIGWDAGERAGAITSRGTSNDTLRIADITPEQGLASSRLRAPLSDQNSPNPEFNLNEKSGD